MQTCENPSRSIGLSLITNSFVEGLGGWVTVWLCSLEGDAAAEGRDWSEACAIGVPLHVMHEVRSVVLARREGHLRKERRGHRPEMLHGVGPTCSRQIDTGDLRRANQQE